LVGKSLAKISENLAGSLWTVFVIKKYSGSGVASVAFFAPVISFLIVNMILNEAIVSSSSLAIILVSIVLYLINKRNPKTS